MKLPIKKPWFLPASLGIVCFIFYALQVPSVPIAYGDSDGFITLAHYLGLMQPPGYALNILLLKGMMLLPLPATLAFKAHLLSAILSSLTLTILTAIIQQLTSKLTKLTQALLMTLSVATLGLSSFWWQYSTITEKYMLHHLLIIVTIYLCIRIVHKPTTRTLTWLGLTTATGLLYHSTYLLILPVIVYTLYISRKHLSWRSLLASFVLGTVINLGLLLAINHHITPYNWQFEPTISGLWHQYARTTIGGLDDRSGVSRGLFSMELSPRILATKLPLLTQYYSAFFSLPILVAWLVGIYVLIKNKRTTGRVLAIWAICTTIFIPLYLHLPDTIGSQALMLRLHLMGFLTLPIAITTFVLWTQKKWHIPSSTLNIGLAIALILLLARAYYRYPSTSLKHFTLMHDLYTQELEQAPKDALVYCDSDVACFGLMAAQVTEYFRPDVTIIPPVEPLAKQRIQEQALTSTSLTTNPYFMLDLVGTSRETRPIVVADLHTTHQNVLGMGYGLNYLIPSGYTATVSAEPVTSPLQLLAPDTVSDIQDHPPTHDPMREYIYTHLARNQSLMARAYLRLNQPEEAAQLFAQARSIAANLDPELSEWIDSWQEDPDSLDIKPFLPDDTVKTVDTMLEEAIYSLEIEDYEKAYLGLTTVLSLDPTNQQAYEELAKLFTLTGRPDQLEILRAVNQ